MKRLSALILFLLTFFIAGCITDAVKELIEDSTYAISGKVADSASEPITGAVVSITGDQSPVTTASDGKYTFSDLKKGWIQPPSATR